MEEKRRNVKKLSVIHKCFLFLQMFGQGKYEKGTTCRKIIERVR